ncbi:hypothetical protein [Pelagibacterium luteolum]|uniref:Uncharacterized protein n=1 Tax=Pelagibacterium luteolum TaxID=440168 RepID=A0A1G7XX40_9HYPH|nr:hypothetical protein [Pelagibacterium luteolum]SDG88606.1 hypothetical protein SAMN04487974_11149 [Pelagibacterium luteolum]
MVTISAVSDTLHPQHDQTDGSESYRNRFPDITVGFNWQRFETEQWPVERQVVVDRGQILSFHTFFRYSLGRINGHFLHWLNMRLMTVGEVLKKLDRVPKTDQDSIRYFASLYDAANEPVELSIPTFALPHGGQYLMDFNHRVCGLALSGVEFRLDVHSIKGPLSAEVLKDATHCKP